MNYQKNMRNILKLFSAVSSTMVNSMILIVSRAPIRLMKRETIIMMKRNHHNDENMYNKQQQQKYVDPRSACDQIWHCHPLIVSHKRKVAVWLRETNPLTFVCALENFDVHHYSWDPYSGLTAKITRHISHKYYRTFITYLSCIHGHRTQNRFPR